MAISHEEYNKKLKEFAQSIEFKLPTEEEIEEVYRTFREHECLAQDIRSYKGLSDDEAWAFASRVIKSEETDNPIDWTEPEIDFGLNGRFSKMRYKIVDKLSNNLSDSKLLETAKAGILSLSSSRLFINHPLTFIRYKRINDLVREAYYAYYKRTGRFKLEEDQEKLIELYESLLEDIDKLLEFRQVDEPDKDKCIEYFNSFNKDVNVGIIISRDNDGRRIYSPESFNKLYYSGLITNKSSNLNCDPKRLIGEKEIITEEIDKISGMYFERYRDYKLGLMNLTKEEQKKYYGKVKRYEKELY